MALKYYHATNTGKGFITHAENEANHIAGHPGEVWTTENTTWPSRVGATEKTFAEAQTLVSASISGSFYDGDHPQSGSAVTYTLPKA